MKFGCLWKGSVRCRTRLKSCALWSARWSGNGGGCTGALNAVAQVQAARAAGALMSFREMQEQARDIDRRRVEIAVRIAEIEATLN
jgi:hypothetical protein